MQDQRWIVVADSPFLPANGGGEREHLGFVRAAARAGCLALLVVPGAENRDASTYQRELGNIPIVVTKRRTSPLLLLHPTKPYVVASRPAPPWLPARVAALAPDATGVVVFSYKSREIGEAVARGLGLPAVLRQHNREGAYHRSLATGTPGPRGLALAWEAWRIERDERALGRAEWLAGTADISAADAAWRRGTGAHNVVHVPPFALDLGPAPTGPTPTGPTPTGPAPTGPAPVTGEVGLGATDPAVPGDPQVLFLGALDVSTNTDAIGWFVEQVWPEVLRGHPTAVLQVVGRAPSDDLRRKLATLPRVTLAADVPDVRPYLAGASVAINPAVSGSGVNIKLIEYLDAAIPLVSTSLATRGLSLEPGADLEVHDDAAGFAAAVLRLLGDPESALAMAKRGQTHLREILDTRVNLERIATMLSRATSRRD